MAVAALATGVILMGGVQEPLRATDARAGTNLASLARAGLARVNDAESDNAELRDRIDALTDEAQPDDAPTVSAAVRLAAGAETVSGPGVVVTLTDAPPPARVPPGRSVDDYVVHQQDIEAVIDALWAGGAEAVAIQDKRVVATSSIRCVGNVILVDGETFSPPYVVAAIGPTTALEESLAASPALQVYQQHVSLIDLGWDQDAVDHLEMPAYTGTRQLIGAQSQED